MTTPFCGQKLQNNPKQETVSTSPVFYHTFFRNSKRLISKIIRILLKKSHSSFDLEGLNVLPNNKENHYDNKASETEPLRT